MVTPLSTGRIDAAVAAGAEALFTRRRPDGVFAPDATEDRFSPANTALALIALHLAQATGPDTARAVDRLVKAQRESGGWAMRASPSCSSAVSITARGTGAFY